LCHRDHQKLLVVETERHKLKTITKY